MIRSRSSVNRLSRLLISILEQDRLPAVDPDGE
jgi:hypothetical protein